MVSQRALEALRHRHEILNLARLPVPPLAHINDGFYAVFSESAAAVILAGRMKPPNSRPRYFLLVVPSRKHIWLDKSCTLTGQYVLPFALARRN